jgi:hypothetical protein
MSATHQAEPVLQAGKREPATSLILRTGDRRNAKCVRRVRAAARSQSTALGCASVLHVPGDDTDGNADDRTYLVLAKPNVIMNDIRLRGAAVGGVPETGWTGNRLPTSQRPLPMHSKSFTGSSGHSFGGSILLKYLAEGYTRPESVPCRCPQLGGQTAGLRTNSRHRRPLARGCPRPGSSCTTVAMTRRCRSCTSATTRN